MQPDTDWIAHHTDSFVGGTLQGVQERRRGGLIEIGLRANDSHKNLRGIVHGGVVMALFDRTIGINCREACPGERMVTASITINLMRQVRVGDFVEFRCQIRKQGRKALFVDAEAWIGEKLVASATGVWMKIA